MIMQYIKNVSTVRFWIYQNINKSARSGFIKEITQKWVHGTTNTSLRMWHFIFDLKTSAICLNIIIFNMPKLEQELFI